MMPETMKRADTELTIREFGPSDGIAFRRLNEEWILRYFALEPKDIEILADPEGTILAGGGKIFVATRNGEVVGCCALDATGPGEFEVVKMAVTESCRRIGVGRRLLESAIAAARVCGATRLHLETNSKLAPAIRLYESLGFRHLPPERLISSPYMRANVFMELHLEDRA
jgi:putative acetyltransferase